MTKYDSDSNSIVNKIREIISETLYIDPNLIGAETDFRKDLGADSIDLASIAMLVEEEFDVTIDFNKANLFINLNSIHIYLEDLARKD